MDLVDRSQLYNIEELKKYENLLYMNDEQLINEEVIERNLIQNALIDLLGFVDEVINLPQLNVGINGDVFNPRFETSDEWLDIN